MVRHPARVDLLHVQPNHKGLQRIGVTWQTTCLTYVLQRGIVAVMHWEACASRRRTDVTDTTKSVPTGSAARDPIVSLIAAEE